MRSVDCLVLSSPPASCQRVLQLALQRLLLGECHSAHLPELILPPRLWRGLVRPRGAWGPRRATDTV